MGGTGEELTRQDPVKGGKNESTDNDDTSHHRSARMECADERHYMVSAASHGHGEPAETAERH